MDPGPLNEEDSRWSDALKKYIRADIQDLVQKHIHFFSLTITRTHTDTHTHSRTWTHSHTHPHTYTHTQHTRSLTLTLTPHTHTQTSICLHKLSNAVIITQNSYFGQLFANAPHTHKLCAHTIWAVMWLNCGRVLRAPYLFPPLPI